MNELRQFLRTRQFWIGFAIFWCLYAFVLIISDLNQPVEGVYKCYLPIIDIELQKGGKVFISPKNGGNGNIYCATEGRWSKINNEIMIYLDKNDNCEWINDLNGEWLLGKGKRLDGTNTWMLSHDVFKLIKE